MAAAGVEGVLNSNHSKHLQYGFSRTSTTLPRRSEHHEAEEPEADEAREMHVADEATVAEQELATHLERRRLDASRLA